VTTAIILDPSAASFQVVAGIPLIVRTVLSAQRGGFEHVIAYGGAYADRLRQVLASDPRTRSIPVATGDARPAVRGERVALIPSDCLLTPAALKRVCAAQADDALLLFEAGGLHALGSGILLGPRAILDHVDGHRSLEALLAALPAPVSVPLGGETCLPVRDAAGVAAAEDELIAGIRAESADTDGPIARFDRGLSTRISRVLVRTPLRPNHITMIGTCLGLLAGWCLSRGTYLAGVLGTLLFWFAVIIDGCDGEVARLKIQDSKFGQLFDVITDNIVHVAIFAGLGVGQYRANPDANYLLLLGLLVTGFLCATAASVLCLLRHPPVKYLRPQSKKGKLRQWMLRGFEALMNRDFAYLLVLLALLGHLDWFLWGAAFGTYAFTGGLVAIYRWRDAI